MKLNKAFLAGAFALAALSGCGSSNSPANNGAAVANAQETPVVDEGPAHGTPAAHMDVSGRALMIDGTPVDRTDENQFQGFPSLASRVSESWMATRAIMTTEGNLEIYDHDTLLFIIASAEGTPSISYSRSGFTADSISWTLSAGTGDQGQNVRHGLLKLALSECMADQGQDKGEQEAPDQGEKAPDQGEKAPDQGEKAPDQGEKAPDQGEKAPDQSEKAPEQRICKSAVVELSFMEVITKEPDQGQKAPDQGEQDKGQQENPVKEEPVKENPVKEEPVKEEPKQENPVKEEPNQGQK